MASSTLANWVLCVWMHNIVLLVPPVTSLSLALARMPESSIGP
jgi:hypothetical protein